MRTDFRRHRVELIYGSIRLIERWATRKQVETCHPQLAELVRLKRRVDPEERFQSDWYRHYRAMFA